MAIKRFKPVTPTQRFKTSADFSVLTSAKPCKSLVKGLVKSGGRNNIGRISVRHRGGGHKRRYRFIDFKRSKLDVVGCVSSVEYDPNRSSYISLISYSDGEKRYIISPKGLKVGMKVVSSRKGVVADIGNSLPLKNIPLGVMLHNIEMYPGKGGQIVRSAGSFARLLSKDGRYCNLRLPSGEVRKFFEDCMATVGQVGNVSHEGIVIGKAGRKRWLGRRSKVRGVAMNPIDHPHGGGEGKTSGGRHPVTPWGKPTKGYKTRALNKRSEKLIVSRKK